MATVLSRRAARQSALPPVSPTLAHALAAAARKPAADSRGRLSPGAYEVNQLVRVVGTLTVGHDSATSATVTPAADVLLALVLSKLNMATRRKILQGLPAEFEANGGDYPEVDVAAIDGARWLCYALRKKVTQKRRGAVGGNLAIQVVDGQPGGLRVAG